MRSMRSVIYKGNSDSERAPAIFLRKGRDQFEFGVDTLIDGNKEWENEKQGGSGRKKKYKIMTWYFITY